MEKGHHPWSNFMVYGVNQPLLCSSISSSCMVECKHITLDISMLNNIFPCILKREIYHLKYTNDLHKMSQYK